VNQVNEKNISFSSLRRLLKLVLHYRVRFWLASFFLLVSSGVALIYPQIVRVGIDAGIRDGSIDRLNQLAFALVGIVTVHAFFMWMQYYLLDWLGGRVVVDIRSRVFSCVLSLHPEWFHKRRTGELVGRLSSDVTIVEGVLSDEFGKALRNLVQLIGGLCLSFAISPYLTSILLLAVPPMCIIALSIGAVLRRLSKIYHDSLAEASAQIQEAVGAIETVQCFVREYREARSYRREVMHAFGHAMHLARWFNSFTVILSVAGYAVVACILITGGRYVIAGNMTGGDLTAFFLYSLFFSNGVAGLGELWGALQRALGATERLFAIIDETPDICDPVNPVSLANIRGRVEFKYVHFHYPSRSDQPVLRGLNLSIEPGEIVAIAGHSGAGKSTLISLLLRFYDAIEGAVLLDGVDIRHVSLSDLRRSIAVVAQEPILFSSTIHENIAYGRENATQGEIEAADRDAYAHDFIETLPDGYDTRVGERGVKLSGGQRQRIAIARAILTDPKILILDEATSNLDAESEVLVQKAMARVMREHTTIVISHRLSAMRDADRIVLIEYGRVAQQGRHAELMDRQGSYQRLIKHQFLSAQIGA
jgi:ATP-binding cassette subfamily B protein